MPEILPRSAIVAEARRWIGTPYRHQASLRGAGCDCLGLVRGVWRALIGSEPEALVPYSPDWAEAGRNETLAGVARRHLVEIAPGKAREGDVILFRWRADVPAKHAAIISERAAEAPPRMVHAHDGAKVAEVALIPFWARRLVYAFAFPGVGDDTSSPRATGRGGAS